MNKKTLGLVHTSATLVPIFQELCSDHIPNVNTFNIADDSLIKDVIDSGRLRPETARRVVEHVGSAAAAGADYILVTCSSIGKAVEAAATLTGVPVLRVDQPMADQAVASGQLIGVIATLPTTLEPTADLVRRRAALAKKDVVIQEVLCEGAFEALMSGDADTHDEKVSSALKSLSKQVDVVLLAQASMARVVETLSPADRIVPILASPPIAMEYLKGELS